MSSLVILLRILLSAVLSGLIGLEREMHGCAAGLRTHILVCIGSALFMMTSINVAIEYGTLGDVDPSRIAAGVVTGVGFLGAGAIIRYGSSIRGLTTAASIWAVAALGLAVGAGLYEAAGITTVIALIVLILSRWEERMALKRHGKKLIIKICIDASIDETAIDKIIEAYGGKIKRIASDATEEEKGTRLVVDLILPRVYEKDIVSEISSLPGVAEVSWR